MSEYIDREAAKKAFCEYCDWAEAGSEHCQSCTDPIGKIPAADVVARDCYDRLLAENDELRKERPVRHGRWVDKCVRDWRCSECGGEIDKVRHVDGYYYDNLPRYCPDCGAVMDEEAEVALKGEREDV